MSEGDDFGLRPEWVQHFEKWGEELLRKYPDGIPENIDFERNGNARIVWGYDGFAQFSVAAAINGRHDDFELKDSIYRGKHPTDLDADQLTKLARDTLEAAKVYWYRAKRAADEIAGKEAAARDAREALAVDVAEYSSRLARERSARLLEGLLAEARDGLAQARDDGEQERIQAAGQKVMAAQDRLIALERGKTRVARLLLGLAVAALALAVAGLAATIGFSVLALPLEADCPEPAKAAGKAN